MYMYVPKYLKKENARTFALQNKHSIIKNLRRKNLQIQNKFDQLIQIQYTTLWTSTSFTLQNIQISLKKK